jgi:hypothetical protein
MTKRLFLVTGKPKSGKSTFAGKLAKCHGFQLLAADSIYIEFVEQQWPKLYFEDLRKWIDPHYRMISDHPQFVAEQYGGPGYVKEWEEYLEQRIRAMAARTDNLVAEGWLLSYCKDRLLASLDNVARVLWLEMHSFRCFRNSEELTLEQVANLE